MKRNNLTFTLHISKILICILFLINVIYVTHAQDYSLLPLLKTTNRIIKEGIEEGDDTKLRNALEILNSLIETNPNYYDVIRKLAVVSYLLGEDNNARVNVDRGLALKRVDIAIPYIDIILLLKEQNYILAYEKLVTLKSQYPNNIHVFYLELLYYVAVGDTFNLNRVVTEIGRKYGEDQVYINIYKTVLAIVNKTESVEQDKIIINFNTNYKQNVWMQWLISNFYVSTEQYEQSINNIQLLKNTNIDFLASYAYNIDFLLAYKTKNFKSAIAIAQEFTSRYPEDYNTWVSLAIAHYYSQQYVQSERAFYRALTLVPNDEFVQFMYDTLVRLDLPQMKIVRAKRIFQLNDNAIKLLNNNNVNLAETIFKKILYIDPLNTNARRNLVKVYEKQLKFREAATELENLQSIGYTENNIEFLKNSYYQKINMGDIVTIPKTFKPEINKVWNIEINNITFNDSIIDTEFRRKAIEAYASKSKLINWSNSSSRINNIFELSLDFINDEDTLVANVKVRNKKNKNVLLDFEILDLGNNYFMRTVATIFDTIETLLPKTYTIVEFNKNSEKVILDNTFKDIEIDKKYNVYKYQKSYDFTLEKDTNSYIKLMATPIGTLTIDSITDYYASGTLTKPALDNTLNSTQNWITYLNFLNTLKVNDIIVNTPNIDNFITNKAQVRLLETRKNLNTIKDYMLKMAIIDFDF